MPHDENLPADFDPEQHEVDPYSDASALRTMPDGSIVYHGRVLRDYTRRAVAKVTDGGLGTQVLRCWHCYPDGQGGQICIRIECPFTLPDKPLPA